MAGPQMTPRETGVLLSSLNDQRSHVLGALDGLTDDDLRRPVLPSGWTSIGLVQHLALDVERYWFRNVFAGEAVDQPEDAWHVGPDVPVDDVLDPVPARNRTSERLYFIDAPRQPPSQLARALARLAVRGPA